MANDQAGANDGERVFLIGPGELEELRARERLLNSATAPAWDLSTAKDRADHAVAAAREQFAELAFGVIKVDQCFWYGAVEISPRHLAVWVLLTGAPDTELPRWFKPEEFNPDPKLDEALVTWLVSLRAIIRDEFAAQEWPHADLVSVNFDSSHRVKENGGWNYFK